jgi:hypothetical protein
MLVRFSEHMIILQQKNDSAVKIEFKFIISVVESPIQYINIHIFIQMNIVA